MTLNLEESLFDKLSKETTVKALVSTRVYPIRLPRNVMLPCITYQRISTPRVHTHDSAGGTAHPRFQITCWDDDPKGCKVVADAVRGCLDGFKGTMGTNGATVYSTLSDDENADYDPESQIYWTNLDFIIWHAE